MKIGIRVFFGVYGYESTLKIRKFNMTIQYGGPRCENYLIEMKISTRGFLKSLITNRNLKFEDSIWRI